MEPNCDFGFIPFNRFVPVRYDVDVMVVGGGPAGMAAAVTAARQGSSVFLAEQQGCFGGMGTSGLVPMFCPFTDGVHFLAGGFGREVVDRCLSEGAAAPDETRSLEEKLFTYLTIKAEPLKRVYDSMALEAGFPFLFQTGVIGVEMENGATVKAAICSAKSGLFAVRARVFIDCTGDGDLATMAGASFSKGDSDGNLMAGTLCSAWAGIDWSNEPAKRWDDGRCLEQAHRDGIFSVEDPGLPGMYRVGPGASGGNIGHAFGVDGADEASLTHAFVEQRKRMVEYGNYYRKYLDGYTGVDLIATAPMMGIRETRRITSDYVLCVEDFRNRAVFHDEIGRYNYGVDHHPVRPGLKAHEECQRSLEGLKYGKGESYGIPYRTLTPRGLDNMLVAGRCISVDRAMLGSVRVMPGCFITGQAAGMAAALAAEGCTGTRDIDMRDLQRRLKVAGAYLPNLSE